MIHKIVMEEEVSRMDRSELTQQAFMSHNLNGHGMGKMGNHRVKISNLGNPRISYSPLV